MNQLTPVISALQIGQGGYDRGPQLYSFHALEDFVIRGIISKDHSYGYAAAAKLFIGGNEGQADGDKVLDASINDFCYNFIPLEVPVAEGDLVKINHVAGAGLFSLLSDKAVDLRRLYDDAGAHKLSWQGGTPSYQTGDGGYIDFSGIASACYLAFDHKDIFVRCRVQLYYPTYPTTRVHSILGVRSTQNGQTRYQLEVETYVNAGSYSRSVVIAKYVNGTRTVLATGGGGSNNGAQNEWMDFWVGVVGNRFFAQCYSATWLNAETSIADGDYLFIPTGNNLKIAQLDIY